MKFVLFQGDDDKYRWRLDGRRGRVEAVGAAAYKSFKTCCAKMDEFRELIATAAVDEGAGTAAARVRIVRDQDGAFRWELIAPTGRKVAQSGASFRRGAAAAGSVDRTREAAPAAFVDLAICPVYAATPSPAYWDGDVTLVVLPASITDFGPAPGAVRLLGGSAQSTPLAVREWTPGRIRVRLPKDPPFAGPHQIVVDTAVVTGCAMPLVINVPKACTFKVSPQPAWWGDTLTLSPIAPTSFGSLHGQVSLVGADVLLQVHPLAHTHWDGQRITVTLPASPPFPGPVYAINVKSPEVFGASSVTIDAAHLVQRLLDAAASEIRLAPGAPVTVGPGDKVAVALSGLPSSVSVPGIAAIPVAAEVSWSVQTGDGTPADAADWRRLGADQLSGAFVLAPGVVEAGTTDQDDRRYVVVADVTLRAAGASVSRRLSVAVTVSALRVPSVLALFNHASFDLSEHGGIPACVLVAVPGARLSADVNAVLRPVTELADRLRALGEAFSTLRTVGSVATAIGALVRLAELLTIMRDTSADGEGKSRKLIVRATDSERLLHRIVFYREFLYTHSGEDTFGSFIFVGMSGRRARFFNARELSSSEGMFEVTIPRGALAVIVTSLHANPPATDPRDAVTSWRSASAGSFGDRMSSFEFPPRV